MKDLDPQQLFMAIHSGNPREAPGSREATRRALALCEGLPSSPRVLDLGCGPGTHTLELAEACGGTFVAVDLHQPYLDRLSEEAHRRGLSERIETVRADMAALDFAPRSFDLVWCEGAIYNVGFREGLEAWRPLLVEGGWLAVSEATWLTEDPPGPALAFWEEAYPAMQGVEANLRTAQEAGFAVVDSFRLPASCWHDYYAHVASRLAELEPAYAGDAEAIAVFEAERREIELYERFGESYGYVFYVLRRREPAS